MASEKHLQRIGIVIVTIGLASLVLVASAGAQEARWKELNNQTEQLYQQGKYPEAIPVAQQAVEIAEKTFGPEHPNIATSLNNLAKAYYGEGRYAEAEPLYKHALAIRQKALGSEHPDVATNLNHLALLYQAEGRYAEAEPLYKRALAIDERALGPEHPTVATNLNNLAAVYDAEGRYAEAEPLLKRALSIDEKALGPEHPDVATSLGNLAAVYKAEGRYADAEPLSKRALAIDEKALGPVHPDVATDLGNLAAVYKYEGRYADAEPLSKRALAIDEKALGLVHPDVAADLNNLAELYRFEGRYTDAEPLSKRALAIREKALGPVHPDVAESLNLLALLYQSEGRDAEAEPLYKRALAIREKALGPVHPDVAIDLNNLAAVYQSEGRYADAGPLFKRALAIDEKTFGPGHHDVAIRLYNLAGLYDAEGRYPDAGPLYQRANTIVAHELRAQLPYISEKERLEFLAARDAQFQFYFSFVHRYRDRDPKLAEEMYDVLLLEKGMVAGTTAAIYRQTEASRDRRAVDTFQRLATIRQQIAALYQGGRGGQEAEQLEGQANELERQLAQLSQSFAQHQKLGEARWQQVREALRPGEAAVEFTKFRYHDGKRWTKSYYYSALVLTPESSAGPRYVFLGDADKLETQGVGEYLEESRGVTPIRMLSMHDVVWKPLEPALGNAKRIYVSPDGMLNQISLGLIRGHDGRLLLERYDLRVVNSTRDLLRDNSPSSTKTAVLVGNPAFGMSESQQRQALAALTHPLKEGVGFQVVALEQGGAAMMRSRELAGGALKPLPQTASEITELDRALTSRGWTTTPLTDKQALKAAVVQVAHPRVLHIATHGFFLGDQQVPMKNGGATLGAAAALKEDPMLRSGLYLAGADRALSGRPSPPDLDDGILTAYEASALDLDGTELVVLSACDTGLGETRAGEGVFGLRRALQEAGAESVLMSMWSVPDLETRELMNLFYEKWLGGESKPDALRHAELQERQVVSKRYHQDRPALWGGFVLVGN